MARVITGKYEVLGQIGKGGMGVVYKVRHTTLETLLALKVLPAELAEDADLVRRFHQEARVMAQLRHPNIVHVLDWIATGTRTFSSWSMWKARASASICARGSHCLYPKC